MKKTKTMMAVALAAVLSACGGSDGDDLPSLAQYAGT